jgi:hypothetical protein
MLLMKHSNDIVIKRFSDTAFSSEDVHPLVDEAWQRWFDAGLDSVWFHSSVSPPFAASAISQATSPPASARTVVGI